LSEEVAAKELKVKMLSFPHDVLRWGRGVLFFMPRKLLGYLDRLGQNLEVLDEEIERVRSVSKAKGRDDRAALQWAKLLRDLVEQRNVTLTEIKAHLLGRDQTGAIRDPPDHYDGSSQVMFERDFQQFFGGSKGSDLRLRCEDCGVEGEDVSPRLIVTQVSLGVGDYTVPRDEYHDLCPRCYKKRSQQ
jgi:hypothetical protein